MKEKRVMDRGCYERGCACHDDRVDTDGVVVLLEIAMNMNQQPEVTDEEEQEWKMRELDAHCNGLSRADLVKTVAEPKADDMQVGGSHYKELDPQPWDVMEALLTPEEFRGFLKGNMIKYAMRQGKKDSPDAGKYHHYKKKLREVTAGEPWL